MSDVSPPEPTPAIQKASRWPSESRLSLIFSGLAVIFNIVLGIGMYQNAKASRDDGLQAQSKSEQEKALNDVIDHRVEKSLKLSEISGKLDNITERLRKVEADLNLLNGWRQGVESRFKVVQADQQELKGQVRGNSAIARLIAPNRVLGVIQAELQMARERKQILSPIQLSDYKNALLHSVPKTTEEYWIAVAALINYQSRVNQFSGLAPDPAQIARPCITGEANLYTGGQFQKCSLELGGNNLFRNVVFRDSVIIYRGDRVGLDNVLFINCTFVLELPPGPVPPQAQNLLLAIVQSESQATVRLNG